MIFELLAAATASAASPAASPNVAELIGGASHAVHANRLDQADLMLRRAIAGGASGAETARVIADLTYARGNYSDALARYEQLLKTFPNDRRLIESASIAALKVGDYNQALKLLSRAKSLGGGSWRLWNALGVAADFTGDWAAADKSYDEACRLAPSEAAPVNNRGWSMLLRGRWQDAVASFEEAASLDPKSARVASNLELARNALQSELPHREPGETDSSWAAHLNDAGVAAAILGDKVRASAAFTQALDVSGTWYARAANNLEVLGGR